MDALNFAKHISPWLDQNLFEKVIRSYQNDQTAQVNSFEIKAATQPGENFASAVFRGILKFSSKFAKDEKEISVIIKTQPVGVEIPGMEHLQDSGLFETEIAIYTKVLSEIVSLMKSVGDSNVMCPKLIYQTLTPKPVIILEDVSVVGYDTMIKTIPDDLSVGKRIIKRLAKYHAAGFFLDKEQKIDASHFKNSLYAYEELAKAMFDETLEIFIQKVESWDGFEQFVEPLKEFRKNYMEKGKKSYSPSAAFSVLNHGDFHLKNILYKMDDDGKEGGVEDFVFLDFQIGIYASPAIDLSYALYNFVSDENRGKCYNELLQCYHQQFTESLKLFGYLKTPPSLLDLHIEMIKNGNVQVFIATCFYPFLITDLNTFTAEDFALGPAFFKDKIFSSEYFKELMRIELPKFLHRGFLK